MKSDTWVFAAALVLALAGVAPLTPAMAQSVQAPAPTTAATSADASADATAAQSGPAPTGRGRKTVGQGMNAQAEAGEPRVDTSASGTGTAPASSRSTRAAGATLGPALAPGKTIDGKAGADAAAGAAAPGQPKPAKQSDRVDLDTTTVTGNRELPKVMYVVPWKKSDIGDLGGKPMNSLLDEVLAPVDRDVFRREVTYYQTLNSTASQNGASEAAPGSAGAKQGEK